MAKRLELDSDNDVVDQFRVFSGFSFVLFVMIVAAGIGISYFTGQPLWQWVFVIVGLAVLFSIKVVRHRHR